MIVLSCLAGGIGVSILLALLLRLIRRRQAEKRFDRKWRRYNPRPCK